MSNFDYFAHENCEYFPCHEGADPADFNCLFCFCPLYALGSVCGGDFVYLSNGVKDCSNCLYPHRRSNYSAVCERLAKLKVSDN